MPSLRPPLLALAVLLAASAGVADEGPSPGEVRRAIDAGSEWLRKEFAKGFEDERFHDAVELVVLTLAHAGANRTDKVFTEGLSLLEKVQPRFTYRASLLAMALSEVNPRLHQAKIAHCAQFLVDTQLAGGEWGYPGTVDGAGRRPQGITVDVPPVPEGAEPGDTTPRAKVVIRRRTTLTADRVLKGDFSNTQFAILGLRACREAGIELPKETWKAALGYLRKFQRPDGGWGYVLQGEQDGASYSSLTCAGVCSLAICLDALGTKDVRADPALAKAMAWLDKNLDPSRNVGIEDSTVLGPSPWQCYHLYSLERAGRVLGLEAVGKRSWYAEGSRWLLAAQHGDGHWADGEGHAGARPRYLTPADTCFAILFLARATRPITGD